MFLEHRLAHVDAIHQPLGLEQRETEPESHRGIRPSAVYPRPLEALRRILETLLALAHLPQQSPRLDAAPVVLEAPLTEILCLVQLPPSIASSADVSHARSNSSASAALYGNFATRFSVFFALVGCFSSMWHKATASNAGTLSWSSFTISAHISKAFSYPCLVPRAMCTYDSSTVCFGSRL